MANDPQADAIVQQAYDNAIQHPDRGWPWLFLIITGFILLATVFGSWVITSTLYGVVKRQYKAKVGVKVN